MRKFTAFFLLLSWALALGAAEPIEVSLATDSALLPTYLVPWNSPTNGGSERSYMEALERVWRYDFAHNGITQQLADIPARRKLADGPFESMGPQTAWQGVQTRYVVKVKIENNQIAARVLDVASGAIKATQTLPLKGEVSADRRQVHHIADAIVKAISGREGIASTSLLYTVRTNNTADKWQSDIWECDYDGANAHAVVQGQGYCVCPAYLSPTCGKAVGGFCYVSYLSGQPKIYIAARKNPVGRRLTELRGNQLMPTMTRQRDSIAFISDVAGNPDLFLLAFDPETGAKGKPRQIFSARPATQASPSFSPDGKQLAFVSDKDGSPRIYTVTIPPVGMPLQQIKAKLITKLNRESSAPAWSPNGRYISYCSMTEGVRQIWSYDLEKNKERQLTFGPGHKENPSWAPDSLHLVYNLSDNDQSELYFLDTVQLQPQQLPLGGVHKRFPSWEPR